MEGDPWLVRLIGLLALGGVAFVLFQAWILKLCAAAFAEVEVSFGRALLSVVLAGLGSAAATCVGNTAVREFGRIDVALVQPELVAIAALGWLVWALVLSVTMRLDVKALLLTSLGLAGVNTALGWAINAAWYVGA